MKEIIKYRIRKKAILVDLIHVVIAHYERLSKYSSSVTNTAASSPLQSLLSNEDKSERKAKIKDLLNEVSLTIELSDQIYVCMYIKYIVQYKSIYMYIYICFKYKLSITLDS